MDEPDDSSSTGSLGTISSPNQATLYEYDTLNNLTTVTQGVQTRTFAYDALSRLKSATNPESGTINYTYDANGNLTSKIDARTITTTYTYDALNRVKQRSYSGESGYTTPTVNYFYDNLTNGKGKLKKVTSSVSTTEYTSFDILGRVTGHKQTTDGEEYETDYTYNLSGALIEQTYPSGRVVKNVLDNNGDLSMVQSRKNENFGYWAYANSFSYNAAGAVTSMQLGNGHWESTQFNSRLQPTQIALGVTPGASNLLKLNYSYGSTNNNGNVLTQQITVKRPSLADLVFDQSYTYDSLNRLKSAEEVSDSLTTWKQVYTFDRYGNRNFDEEETTTLVKNCGSSPNFTVCAADKKVFNPDLNPANNRMASGQEYTYDAAGNVIEDAEGRTFTYDAENKQVEVENSLSQTVGQYLFDGDGKRVKKIVPLTGEVTIFVYDAGAKLIGEYSTVVETQDPKVQYLTNDHLGSPRINTDQDGHVTSRTDYMPYGEEITGLGNRTVNENYTSDDVRQGFTGYEKDYETGLDFAQARIYQNRLGRFYSSDPLLSSGYLSNPQSWGRYAYAQNNPLNLTDPSGLFVWDDTLGGSASDTELMETSDGRRIVAKRNEIRNALTRAADEAARAVLNGTLTSQQGAEIFDALAAYGAEGTDNGVIVRLGKVKDGDASAGWQEDKDGNATPFRMDKKTGKATALVYVTFESDKINARNAAHEGSHVYDRQLLAMSLDDPSKAHISPTDREENITRYETERRAYQVTSYLDQGMRTDSNVWQRGWSEADRKQGIDRHIKTAAKVSPPGTTPGPGKRLYEPKLSK